MNSRAAEDNPNVIQRKGTKYPEIDRVAGYLAGVGAFLGVIVGLVDLFVGTSILDWVGNKLDTTRLGLATILLSLVALGAAIAWRRAGARVGGRRLMTMLALALPAAICFTTIGRLWYVPGALLLVAAALILGASGKRELAQAVTRQHWLAGLLVVLGAYYILLGAATLGVAGGLGIFGGLVLWAAVAARRRWRRLALGMIVVGALPFAIASWWSMVTPFMAILALAISAALFRAPPALAVRGHR